MSNVYVIGAGMVHFGRFPETQLTDLGARAVLNALDDCRIDPDRIGAMFVGTGSGGSMIGQRVARQVGLPDIPVINFENACSSGSTALNQACAMVRAGIHDFVLVLGLDKLSSSSGTLARHPDDFEGSMGQVAPGLYAMRAQRYLHEHKASVEDLALVIVKNRRHARENDHAMFRQETSVEEVLASRPICDPLTMLQCCARSDGAAALIVTNERNARSIDRFPIRVVTSSLCSGRYTPGFRDLTRPEITFRGAGKAFADAGLKPSDIAFAEVHDAFSIAEVLYYEALGFCGTGQGIQFLKSGDAALGGRQPINPSGGLISKGHPPGATGTAQVFEAVLQLRGEAGKRQIPDAKYGLTHCTGGGVSGLDHGTCTIHILAN
jgi:benzoylsuccinyl-CoA thiolase BbsB subunit